MVQNVLAVELQEELGRLKYGFPSAGCHCPLSSAYLNSKQGKPIESPVEQLVPASVRRMLNLLPTLFSAFLQWENILQSSGNGVHSERNVYFVK